MSGAFRRRIVHPGSITGRFYATINGTLGSTNTVGAVDVIYFYLFMCPTDITFTGGKARTQTLGAGSSIKFGIWADSPVSHRPLGAPLFKDDVGITTQVNTADVTVAIGAGSIYEGQPLWIGSKCTGTLPAMWGTINLQVTTSFYAGTTGALNTTSLSFADAYANAMPTIAEGGSFTANTATVPHLWLAT